jgi:nucleoside-diphosphate-sugar epimerase
MKFESPSTSAPRCYLVTGAAGFIASQVCEQLLAAGHTVVGVDNLNDYYDVRLKLYRVGRLARLAGANEADIWKPETGNLKPELSAPVAEIAAVNSGFRFPVSGFSAGKFTFHALDIEDLASLDAVFAAHKFSAVFNLAARAGVRYSIQFPELYRRTNILGEENVLKCQVKHGVRKHVLASSSSVYAGCPMPFSETAALGKMQSPYAETKRAAELLAKDYHDRHGLDVSVLRYFTVFGPAGRPDMAPFRFIKWIDEGTPITLFGDGNQARDFTYVEDIARGTILAAGQKPETGNLKPEDRPSGYEIYNLGGGNNPVSLHTIIRWIEAALNEERSKTTQVSGFRSPVSAKIAGQPASAADMRETWADIAKAKRVLGWSPAIAPEEGFRRTVSWYQENRGWIKGIAV